MQSKRGSLSFWMQHNVSSLRFCVEGFSEQWCWSPCGIPAKGFLGRSVLEDETDVFQCTQWPWVSDTWAARFFKQNISQKRCCVVKPIRTVQNFDFFSRTPVMALDTCQPDRNWIDFKCKQTCLSKLRWLVLICRCNFLWYKVCYLMQWHSCIFKWGFVV